MDLKFKKPFLIFSLFICLFLSLSDASTKRLLERYCTLQYDDDTKFYDLRSLSLRSEHLTVKNETDTYFVNICSTTNAFKSANQKPLCVSSTSNPTSICLVNSGKPDEGIEIAHLHSGKLQVENGSLFMRFRNPDEDEAKKLDASCVEINTTILFSCAKSRPNELPPVLTKRSKCAFEFEWKSSEACVDQHTIIEPHQKNDSLIFLVNGTKVDLSEIMKPQAIKVEYQNNGKPSSYDFVIRINELKQYTEQSTVNLTGCNDSFVCQVDASSNFTRVIANLKNNQLKHANGEFHLVTSSESKCGRDMTKNTSAIFNFYCNTTQVDGNIAFVAENNLCHYIFNLTHPKVCEYEALFDGPSKNDEVKPVTDKPKTDSTTVSPPTTPATVKPDPAKKNESSPTIDPPSSSKISPDENNSNTTAFGLVILALVTIVGIVLVFFALINDDRRSWLQKRLRRVINPQTTTSFSYSHGYSQLPANNILLINNEQSENFASPYSPTVMPKTGQFKYDTLMNERNNTPRNSLPTGSLPSNSDQPPQYDLRNDSNTVRSSIREQLDRLKLINDNDLGVSSGNFHRSIGFRNDRSKSRPSAKDEELDLLT